MKKTALELSALSESLFSAQYPMRSLWQSMAEHFYPERADFTITRNIGAELSDSLVDSYPVLIRRDMGNSLSALLRQGDWFDISISGEPDYAGKAWLEWATKRQYQFLRNRKSNFVRSTKEGDHDYCTFGQCVISVEMNRIRDGLLFRCWHLRDCAWFDDENGQVGGLSRKWKPKIHELCTIFGEQRLHQKVVERKAKFPFSEVNCGHIVIPSEMYGDEKLFKFKYVSVWIDFENNHEIAAYGENHFMYVVPRFQTISGSPYACSPATMVGLPDARTLQAMTFTILEAGERYVRPPLVATHKVIRGDVDLSPDGITWVDDEYDEKMGASLRPLVQDRGGFPIGFNMKEGLVNVLRSAFFLDKINLPPADREMTAYEFSERMKQYRREILPLIAPIESEYNGQICDAAFTLLMSNGLMGSPYDIPDSLKGKDVEFKFISPLSKSEEEEKVTRFSIVSKLLKEAAEFDQDVIENINFDEALRDAVTGSGAPTKWMHDLETVKQSRIATAQQRDALEQAQKAEAQAGTAMAQETQRQIANG